MAKVLLITDTHFGVGSKPEYFLQNMKLFLEKVFFTYLQQHGEEIAGIVHGGDFFHNRRRLDTLTANYTRQFFLGPLHKWLHKTNKQMHIVCGNHDSYFKDSLAVNNLKEFIYYQDYSRVGSVSDTIKIHTEFTEIPEWNMCLIPWLTKNNREQVHQQIQRTNCSVAVGHLELAGFNFSKVQTAMHGDDPSGFSKFDYVFSGHYHYRHNKSNIYYLGSPTQQTWIDDNTTRGFHVFDTETGNLEFIENPYNIFETVKLGEALVDSHPRFFRVIRTGEEKQSEVDAYLSKLYTLGAIHIDVIVKNLGKNQESGEAETEQLDSVEGTPEFIRNNVPDVEVAEILLDLYNRATTIES